MLRLRRVLPYSRKFLCRSECTRTREIVSVRTWRYCHETTLREAVTCWEWGRLADWPCWAKLSQRLLWQWCNNHRESHVGLFVSELTRTVYRIFSKNRSSRFASRGGDLHPHSLLLIRKFIAPLSTQSFIARGRIIKSSSFKFERILFEDIFPFFLKIVAKVRDLLLLTTNKDPFRCEEEAAVERWIWSRWDRWLQIHLQVFD